jgi:hypothetical protein
MSNSPKDDDYQVGYVTGHRDAMLACGSLRRFWVAYFVGFTCGMLAASLIVHASV